MKYRYGFVVFLLIYSELVYSQGGAMPSNFPTVVPVRGLNVNTGSLMGMGVKYNDGSYVNEKGMNVAGTPLLFENWNYGTVWMKTGEKFDSMHLKYDMLNDLLYVHLNDMDYQFKDEISSFRITDSATLKVFMFRTGFKAVSVFDSKSFYQVLYDGKTKFVQKRRKLVVSELTSTPGVKRDSFSDENTYYIVTATGEMKKLKKKNDDIIELLDGHKEELKKMIKEQRLKLNKDEEIIQLLHYYDQLEAH
jgi:hypothetical protein